MTDFQIQHLATQPSSGRSETLRVTSPSGTSTVHVARWPFATHRARIVLLDEPLTVAEWCVATGTDEAMNGGFFTKPEWNPLGQVWIDGSERNFTPFAGGWHEDRGAMLVPDDGVPEIASRSELPTPPAGSLLQAGPLLVRDGQVACAAHDPEGFSATQDEFDSDITAEPLPRGAFGITRDGFLAVCVDGRAPDEDGMLLHELAALLVELGAVAALNLDGGSSSALVTGGVLRNVPRDDEGEVLTGGYPTRTAIAVLPR